MLIFDFYFGIILKQWKQEIHRKHLHKLVNTTYYHGDEEVGK